MNAGVRMETEFQHRRWGSGGEQELEHKRCPMPWFLPQLMAGISYAQLFKESRMGT